MSLRKIHICWLGIGLTAALGLGGCAGLSMEGLGGGQYHETRVVRGEKAEVFAACQSALQSMHFAHRSGNPASGRLEMQSGVQPGGAAQVSRQRMARLSVRLVGGLEHEVSIGFWEYHEDVSIGGTATTSGRKIRGGVLYEEFWRVLDEVKPEVSAGEDEVADPGPDAS